MAAPAAKVGNGPCPHCKSPVLFKHSAGGKLSFKCEADGCDASGYAEPGGGQYRAWMASIKLRAPAPAAQAAPAAPSDPAAPPPVKRSAFSLGGLK